MAWGEDGWLRTADGEGAPHLDVEAPDLPEHPFAPELERHDFDAGALPSCFQWLRTPHPEQILSLTARPGHLRLYGRESIGSLFTQALVARRQQAFCYTAETVLDVAPDHYQQMAGLVCYYGGVKFHYLYVSHDETLGKHLRVMSALPDQPQADAFTASIPISGDAPVGLKVEVDYERLYFSYRVGEGAWQRLPQTFDASILSDEATVPGAPNFTGAFVGMAAQDLAGTALPADFDYFAYRERDYSP
jgi:xylan 1,4-beta-xylosidase